MVERLEALKSLHTSLVDSRNGYDEALKDAGGKGLASLFRDMIAIRTKDADELAACLRALGQTPDVDGSYMSTIHRTVMSIRSIFGGLDESVLPGLIDGEKRTLQYYDDAIAATTPSLPDHGMLVRQRAVLSQKVSEMEVRQRAAS
jgi:uncharacterized protein (TIGR02284 family)